MNQQTPAQEIESEASYIAPWARSRTEFVVPERFAAAIGMHLRANFAEPTAIAKPALILGVQGPPGEGKTEMVNICCAHLGCNVFHLSAAAMSGKHEGDARQVLLRNVARARRAALTNDRPGVLVIDDMDRGVASLKDTTGHTINSGLLVGTLQDLANAHTVAAGVPQTRVPLIMTANSFASLAGSLVRPGRMRFFTWQPTWKEKTDMALPLFGQRTPFVSARLRRLVRWYHAKGEPLAFFVQLAHEYVGAAAPWPADCTDILQAAQAFGRLSERALGVLDFGILRRLARELHRAKAESFLRGEASHV